MSIANLGAFLGGLTQGQERAENQKERASYLAMLQEQNKRKFDAEDAGNQALFATAWGQDDNLFAEPGAGAASVNPIKPMPTPGAGAPPAPQTPGPGQASVPMAQPGGGGAAYAGTPNPMAAQPKPPVQAPPAGAAPAGPAAPAGQQPMVQGAPAAPAGQQPQNGYDRAQQILLQAQQQLSTPEAETVAKDPRVVQAKQQMHAFVDELRKQGINPMDPNAKKPDPVQIARMKMLHDAVTVAAADAAKHTGADRTAALKWAGDFANVLVRQEAAKAAAAHYQQVEDGKDRRAEMRANAKGSGGAGGGGPVDEDRVKYFMDYYGTHNAMPARTKVGDPDMVEAQRRLGGRGGAGQDAAGNVADNKADASSLTNITKSYDAAVARYGSLDRNVNLMLDAAKKYGLKGNTLVNDVVNKLRATNDPRYNDFTTALATVQREYGKLADGGSGAAAAHVDSLKQAAQVLNGNFTLEQLQHAASTLEKDGKNVVDGWNDQREAISKRIRTRGSSAPAGAGGAAPPKGGSTNAWMAPNGKPYTADQVNAAAQQLGMSPDDFARSRGLNRAQ